MKAIIKAFADKPSQYHHAKSFRLLNEEFIDGYLVCYQEFDSTEEAKRFLNERARSLYPEDLEEMNRNLWPSMLIHYSAAAVILTGADANYLKSQIQTLKTENHV
jgi:hypothetical protein